MTFSTILRSRRFVFTTDQGVFSRAHVDAATRLLIDALPLPVAGNALDLGCGYGPIGLVIAAFSPEATVYLTDVNQRAIELAAANARANQLENVVVRLGPGFEPVLGLQFSLIATNPPIRAGKRVVYPLLEAARDHLVPGGSLMVVVRTKQGAATMAAKLAEIFGEVQEVEKASGLRVYRARRAELASSATPSP